MKTILFLIYVFSFSYTFSYNEILSVEDEKRDFIKRYSILKILEKKVEDNIEECKFIKEVPISIYKKNLLEEKKTIILYKKVKKKCNFLLIKKKIEEKKQNNQNSQDNKKIPVYKQGKNTNTCVIDNLDLIIQYKFNKNLDKEKIYQKLNKKIGDFWLPGLYITNDFGGNFISIKKNTFGLDKKTNTIFHLNKKEKYNDFKILEERRDREKLEEQIGIKTGLSSSIWYLTKTLESKNPVLIEVQMPILYPEKKEEIFHAISVFEYNQKTNEIVYSDTLDGKIKTLNLDKLKYNENYLKYPFRYINSLEKVDNIFLKSY